MGICSSALYLHLLEDLRSIDSYQTNLLLRGEPVDFYPDASVQQVAELSMAKSFMKKLIDDANPDCRKRAVAKFLACNSHCKDFVLEPGSEWQAILIMKYDGNYTKLGTHDLGEMTTELYSTV